MKMFPTIDPGTSQPTEFAAIPVMEFIEKHQTPLWHAARLLGGYERARLVDRCCLKLEIARRVTPEIRLMLEQILSLLGLENAGNPDLPEMGCFAVIDPADPVVEEICLLCDGLRGAIEEHDFRETWARRQKGKVA